MIAARGRENQSVSRAQLLFVARRNFAFVRAS